MKKTIKRLFSRAALTLTLLLFTSVTAWADITISSTDDWNTFASAVTNGTTYNGQTVTLADDITVTTMAGDADHKFSGTFFGDGHTLTFNTTATGDGCAPFFAIDGAAFKCLQVAGTISTGYKFAAGIAAHSYGICTIQNCQSSIVISSSVSGDGTHGGFVAIQENGTLTFTNCLMDGSITGSNTTNCGGFVGWRGSGALTFNNCLMAGTMAINLDGNSATFNRNGGSTLVNCYYKGSYTNATLQGNATTATDSDLQALLGSGWQVSGNDVVVPDMDTKNIATATFDGISGYYHYTGDEIAIGYTVTAADGTALTKGTDYTETLSPSTVLEKGKYTLTVSGSGSYTGSQTFRIIVGDDTPVTSETTTMTTGTYVVAEDVTINSRITVSGDVVLFLYDNCTMNAMKGINVSSGNSLTINAESTGDSMGTLMATANANCYAGIGSRGENSGNVTINGGNVVANGGEDAAGIGGGTNGSHVGNNGTTTINGGKVSATGGYLGAGIGGGSRAAGGTITINGGEVTAHGGEYAAGIGGGYYNSGGTITINGGKVTANGDWMSPGIGGGYYYDGSDGTITLSYTKAENSVYASSYNGTVSIAPNKTFTDGTNTYTSETPSGTLAALTNTTLTPKYLFNITVSECVHGTVTAQEKAVSGETVPLIATPDENYALKEFIVTDDSDTPVAVTNGQFSMPGSNVTVSATFVLDPAHFSVNDDGTEYTIHTATGWGVFCDALQDNATWNRFSGKTVKLGADIEVTRMAGSDSHDFCGTFDGDGKTLTFNYGTSEAPASVQNVAPFSYVSNTKADPSDADNSPATIKNLHVTGDIYTSAKYAAGIVGQHWGILTIENCHSSIVIHSTVTNNDGNDGTHGGIEAVSNGVLNITGCVFDGKLLTTAENSTTNCGGFVGWRAAETTTISNCLYAPANLADGETEVQKGTSNHPSATFARNAAADKITNSYYTRTLGTEQGKAKLSVMAGENVTTEAVSLVGSPVENGTYSVSGITAYAKGITRGTTFYYGQDDEVSLTLSNTTPRGYTFSGYEVSNGGTLSGDDNPYTLTMPNDNVTVSALFTPIDLSQLMDIVLGKAEASDVYDVNGDKQFNILDVAKLIDILVNVSQ